MAVSYSRYWRWLEYCGFVARRWSLSTWPVTESEDNCGVKEWIRSAEHDTAQCVQRDTFGGGWWASRRREGKPRPLYKLGPMV
jgi:hypothetical protein